MQTNREDVGDRWQEILVPAPKTKDWAHQISAPFRDYFTTIAESRARFLDQIAESRFEFIVSVRSEEQEETDELATPEGEITETPSVS